MTPTLKIDWLDKLRLCLQTLAFCLVIATVQYAFQPQKPYDVPMVYSLLIGTITWALMDFGRHFFPSSAVTGWPQGAAALALPLGAIVTGYGVGTALADAWFGWSSWDGNAASQLRVSLLIAALAGISCTYYFYNRGKQTYLQSQMALASQQAAESRLKLLESQIEPHMLFNTLANLRALISTDPQRALTMLDHLNNYLRATQTASRTTPGHASHTLQTEFDRLRDYMELMAVRMGPRLRYVLDLPPELARLPLPALLLQPIVENSIKHGLEPSRQGGEVRVSAAMVNQQLRLQVSDTGVGLALGQTDPQRGFGLTQVRERLHTLYGDNCRFDMQAQVPHGLVTTLSIPAALGTEG